MSGASGLVGSALVPFLESRGYRVTRLVRHKPRNESEFQWNPTRTIPTQLVSGFDVVIHLSGENIAGRWTEQKKCRIRESRVFTTDFLAMALAKTERKPGTFICASAIGYYGNRGDGVLTEDSLSGEGFFPEVCREWEKATLAASQAGIRVVHLRIGIVLSAKGGALAKMIKPFKFGLGGRVGDGRQYMSWITLDDLVGVIRRAVTDESLRGPVNTVAPNPVTNEEFTKALGRVLGRPTFLPVPAFAARLAFGEMADALLLSSARVEPARLEEAGYEFSHPIIEEALRHVLGSVGK